MWHVYVHMCMHAVFKRTSLQMQSINIILCVIHAHITKVDHAFLRMDLPESESRTMHIRAWICLNLSLDDGMKATSDDVPV